MNKIIEENDAVATIEFKENLSDNIINKIDSIISKNYDKECEYIIKIDKNHYKGDMACLSAISFNIYLELEKINLWNEIKSFDLYNKLTDEYENVIEGVKECQT